MNTPTYSLEEITVFYCKQFQEVVRKTQHNEPIFLITAYGFEPGFWNSSSDAAPTLLLQEFVDAKVAEGFTVTAYVRSNLEVYFPFADDFEKSVAAAVSKKILGKSFPEALSYLES
jgi:hypothetical protein